ncbi:hypothetical protein VOLCADRAFT_119613 [Volvox carteri f. nagariensis]|uniref:Uncharacterized protein n=1 Tax=Volvox carteri f. nagariensis TaxID=3068 RepID=D8UEY7_VOLCA|nr:uncharacterized protein VOLCADRAFT_119613 [Volvox carteri f. nagariensis]EFJ41725.1 hypothetical protein VOLCADRAFT_119613 [Volvox carteri f. nagariensis]|eukprot:XP_002957227.1 hypothetical protein VOLCADRAFT_119613 [Volvox carteri f. nagariensis]
MPKWRCRPDEGQRKCAQPNEESDVAALEQSLNTHANNRRRRDVGNLRHCASCGCSLKASGWEQHVNGIRHRRNEASITLMGEPGHLVRSIFERDPADVSDNYITKDPVAHRVQQLRQLTVSANHTENGGVQRQHPEPAALRAYPNQHHDQRSDGRRRGVGARPTHPPAPADGPDTVSRMQQEPERRRAASPPGGIAPPRRRRPHSEAFAELQARRDQRLLRNPLPLPPPASSSSNPESTSGTDDDSGSDDTNSRSSAATSSSDGGADRSGQLSSLRGDSKDVPGRRCCYTQPTQPSRYPPHHPAWRQRQPEPAAAAAAAAAAPWTPDAAQLAALEAAARREAVHHTGLGPLYEASLMLLGGGALRRGVGELQERLGRYRRRLEVWQQGLQRRELHGRPPAAKGEQERDEGKEESNSGNCSDGSSGGSAGIPTESEEEEEEVVLGAREGGARMSRRQRPLRRPYLRLGPAELLLLSIHPAVATAPAKNMEADTGAPPAATAVAAGPALSDGFPRTIPGRQGHRQSRLPPPPPPPPASRPQQQKQDHVMRESLRWDGRGGGGKGGLLRRPQPPPQQPLPPLQHLLLEVPFKPYGREAAAYATAMCVLLAALRRAGREGGGGSCLESFGVRFSRGEFLQVLAQGGAARMGPLESLWQLAPALVQLVQVCPGWPGELRLCCPPGLLDAGQVEGLQRAAVDPLLRNQRRLAVLMGTHSRLGACSPLRTLPSEVLELVLDKALPRRPCRLVLGVNRWLPGQRDTGLRRRRRGDMGLPPVGGGGGGAAAAPADIWAAPAAAAAVAAQQQQPQQLPLDVRVAARHAARR